MKKVDQRIKKYYENKKLSSAQLKDIVNGTKSQKPKKRYFLRYSIAALLVLGFAYAFLVQPLLSKNKIVKAYAKEIAYNHKKQSAVQIETDDTALLGDFLDKLNFNVSYDQGKGLYSKLMPSATIQPSFGLIRLNLLQMSIGG